MMKLQRFLLIIVGLALASSARADLIWHTDLAAAKVQAAKEGKQLLLEFTGSDWCFYCQKLDDEVLSTEAFADHAQHFVLVRLDYPQKKILPAAEKRQNETLEAQFKIEGFPTVILCDAAGHELHRATGYDPEQGPKAYLLELFGK